MVKWCQVDIHHLLLTYIILYAKKRYSRDLLFTGCWLEKLPFGTVVFQLEYLHYIIIIKETCHDRAPYVVLSIICMYEISLLFMIRT